MTLAILTQSLRQRRSARGSYPRLPVRDSSLRTSGVVRIKFLNNAVPLDVAHEHEQRGLARFDLLANFLDERIVNTDIGELPTQRAGHCTNGHPEYWCEENKADKQSPERTTERAPEPTRLWACFTSVFPFSFRTTTAASSIVINSCFCNSKGLSRTSSAPVSLSNL